MENSPKLLLVLDLLTSVVLAGLSLLAIHDNMFRVFDLNVVTFDGSVNFKQLKVWKEIYYNRHDAERWCPHK